jgi:hypothetical protein
MLMYAAVETGGEAGAVMKVLGAAQGATAAASKYVNDQLIDNKPVIPSQLQEESIKGALPGPGGTASEVVAAGDTKLLMAYLSDELVNRFGYTNLYNAIGQYFKSGTITVESSSDLACYETKPRTYGDNSRLSGADGQAVTLGNGVPVTITVNSGGGGSNDWVTCGTDSGGGYSWDPQA